ncbi:winged helix-turn-helix transcriptional regulator [Candidatus Bathyarchaeota archaeon]|nr:winged helix-turn-helix transcriptional regulator [Candidatus Bathyarchaeota archaeon]
MVGSLSQICYRFFKTLANPTRLDILEVLREGPKSVTEIAKLLNKEQSLISHNLRPLLKCRFVFSERRKRERIYHLNRETMEKIFKAFAYHAEKYCPLQGECLTELGMKKRKKEEAEPPVYVSHL